MSNARFSILQARAISDKRISDAQFRTLAALGMYADKDGWCYPSLKTLGKDLNKSAQAVGRDTLALRKLGYLQVKNRYDSKTKSRHSNLYRLVFDFNMGDSTLSTSDVDTLSTSDVEVNVPINDPIKDFSLSEKEKEQAKEKLYSIIASNQPENAWTGRELIRADLLPYADWYHKVTGQVMTKRVQSAWWKALGEWKAEGLAISDLHEAYDARSKWRKVATPVELTADAVAIHALPKQKLNDIPRIGV